MPFSCFFFGALEACSNPAETGSKSFSGAVGCCPPPKEAAQRLTRTNKGYFCAEVLRDDTTSLRKRMCAFTAYVRFLRRRGPAGLRNLFFGYSVVIFALPHGLSSTRKQWDKTGRTQRPPQSRQKRIEVLLWLGCSPPLKNRTQRLTEANMRDFCVGCLWDGHLNQRANSISSENFLTYHCSYLQWRLLPWR